MNKLARVLLILGSGLLLSLGGLQPAHAQKKGTIAGTVMDGELAEPLPGANVFIEGTQMGTTTDLDGQYRIGPLEPGTYDVQVSFVGFSSVTVSGVEVEAGEPTTGIDVTLQPESYGMEEVTVEARLIRNNEAALLRDRQKSAAVSDAISAEAIGRSGASDAAAAMEKVTGASVVDGKYVYVRGLGDRYSSTQLNGVSLPSADPDKKAVQFDLFPSNLLSNIVTLKTFTPDRPGNFSGGLVDIGTKAFPDQLSLKFSASSSINTEAQLADDFLAFQDGGVSWFSLDADKFAMPSRLASPRADQPVPETYPTSRFSDETAELVNYYSKGTFDGVMAPRFESGGAPIDQSYSLSLGNQSELLGNSLGYVVSLSYSRDASYYDDGLTGRYSVSSGYAVPNLLLRDAKSTQEATLGGIANLTYRFGKNNEIGFNSLYTQTGESMARLQSGGWPEEFGVNDTTSVFTTRVLSYTERELQSYQLRGKHFLPGLLDANVEWTGSYAMTTQEQPDMRFFATTTRVIGGDTIHTASASGFREPSRLYRDLDENTANGKLDVAVPFKQWAGHTGKIKFGGAYERADRDFNERFFVLQTGDPTVVPYTGDPAAYFAPENMGVVDTTQLAGRNRYVYGHVVLDQSKPENRYEGLREVAAGYLMAELPLTRKLRLIGGARLEATTQEVASEALVDTTSSSVDANGYVLRDGQAFRGGRIEETDILPSLNLVYAVTDNMNLRAAATRTLARPTFREFAPFATFSFIGDAIVNGNPSLKRTLITNYDLRWEWFTRPGELLAASVFYKDMDQPIERAIVTTNGQVQYQNVPQARIYGLELEARSSLDRLTGVLADFSVGANVTFTDSQVDIPERELTFRRQADSKASATRNLQGQSPYLVNADVSYENVESGTSAGVFFNVFGARLSSVGLGPVPDIYELPRPQLDLTLSQQLFGDWQVKFSAKNLLGTDYEEAYRFQSEDLTYQRYDLGRSFSLGISYSP